MEYKKKMAYKRDPLFQEEDNIRVNYCSEIIEFLKKSINGEFSLKEQVEFLKENQKLSANELFEIVKFLLNKMPYNIDLPNAIDICGTGGSGLPRINTSTISAFVLASLGVGVAKHGNKAASGRFGSFDLLEAMGIDFAMDSNFRGNDSESGKDGDGGLDCCKCTSNIEMIYQSENLAFLYARNFHPVMKYFVEARKTFGKASFFNIIGPLLNPVNAKRQIIGTAFKDKMRVIAKTCSLLGKERVFVICGEDGLDEVSLTGKTHVLELNNGIIKEYKINPEDFGIKKANFSEIKGGDKNFNLKIAKDILENKSIKRYKDLVLINSALALKLVDKVSTLKDGYTMAKKAIESGLTLNKYRQYKKMSTIPSILLKIIENKKNEIKDRKKNCPLDSFTHEIKRSTRDFLSTLSRQKTSLIAEIKKFSPVDKKICLVEFCPSVIAKEYEKFGADAISVLCDEKFFGGNVKNLEIVKKSTKKLPILAKDFIIDEYQIFEARKMGADSVLLIVSILRDNEIKEFIKISRNLGMEPLCEVHNLAELRQILKTDAKIIGINNRDLYSFKVKLETSAKLSKQIPKDRIIISESGIYTHKDLLKTGKIDGVLVGTSLMKSKNIAKKILDLNGKKSRFKACGIRKVKEAKFCEKLGIDYIGLNFVPTSHRKIDLKTAKEICEIIDAIKVVGIFQNQDLSFVNETAKNLNLDYIQLSGDEDLVYVDKCKIPVIKVVKPGVDKDVYAKSTNIAFYLYDGDKPGSGQGFSRQKLIKSYENFFIAGGINVDNVETIINEVQPFCVDVASGIESNGLVDLGKIEGIFRKTLIDG